MRIEQLAARLRRDCPWDGAQTLASSRPYLLEEAHEVLGALDAVVTTPEGQQPPLAALKDELGDLLFQVAFLAQLASEQSGGFSFEDVVDAMTRKMIRRHPHVFAPGTTPQSFAAAPFEPPPAADPATPTHGIATWEAQKAAARLADPERRATSRIDGVPTTLPALLRAHRVGEKLGHIGFDWPDAAGVFAKVDEERAELDEAMSTGDAAAVRHEFGDLLLTMASLGRFLDVPAEDALREANLRFEGRFRALERLAAADGLVLDNATPAQLDALWRRVKAGGIGA